MRLPHPPRVGRVAGDVVLDIGDARPQGAGPAGDPGAPGRAEQGVGRPRLAELRQADRDVRPDGGRIRRGGEEGLDRPPGRRRGEPAVAQDDGHPAAPAAVDPTPVRAVGA